MRAGVPNKGLHFFEVVRKPFKTIEKTLKSIPPTRENKQAFTPVVSVTSFSNKQERIVRKEKYEEYCLER